MPKKKTIRFLKYNEYHDRKRIGKNDSGGPSQNRGKKHVDL